MPDSADIRLGTSERAGIAVLVAFAAWAVLRTFTGQGQPADVVAYVAGPVALAVGVGLGRRWLARRQQREAELFVGALVGVLVLALIVESGSGGGPLGYANANAALAVQMGALAAVLAARTRTRALPLVLGLVALASTVAFRSIGGVATGLIVLIALISVLAGRPRRHAGWLAAIGALLVTLTLWAVMVLAGREQWPPLAYATLSEARQIMWSDALAIWCENPIAGQGPGAFARLSRLSQDTDTSTAHSSLLQVGAETGWVGVALLAAVVLIGFVLAARGRGPAAAAAIAAWTAMWAHSLGDHIVDFPAVLLVAGIVLGWATAAEPQSEELHITHGQHPGSGIRGG